MPSIPVTLFIDRDRIAASCTYNEDGMSPQDAIAEGLEMCRKRGFAVIFRTSEPSMCTVTCMDHISEAVKQFWSNTDSSVDDLRIVHLSFLATVVTIVDVLTLVDEDNA